ncbi:hypothetical protein CC2G_003788 [Coprinopsis cinerea AmutBmut pab1-1]|nr:hypothetical protein CC2G_003788 [Coprinopsis cinerea AmutBmut pab1-1]
MRRNEHVKARAMELGRGIVKCLLYPVQGNQSVLVDVALEEGSGPKPRLIDLMVPSYMHKNGESNEQVVVLDRSTIRLERLTRESILVFKYAYTVFYSRRDEHWGYRSPNETLNRLAGRDLKCWGNVLVCKSGRQSDTLDDMTESERGLIDRVLTEEIWSHRLDQSGWQPNR